MWAVVMLILCAQTYNKLVATMTKMKANIIIIWDKKNLHRKKIMKKYFKKISRWSLLRIAGINSFYHNIIKFTYPYEIEIIIFQLELKKDLVNWFWKI